MAKLVDREVYMPDRRISRVGGDQFGDTFGETSHRPSDECDYDFIWYNPDLALKLHYSQGVQQLMTGRAPTKFLTNDQLRDAQITQAGLLARANDILNRKLEMMLPVDQEDYSRKILSWTNGYPPMPDDFSDAEVEILENIESSPLAELYLQYLPRKKDPGLTNQLGHQAMTDIEVTETLE
ncbi:MAG TPA: hypothetical protein VLF39_01105 [Candidatus Saccharimonadales bacterium]|nr:hypothetical protein [Candidatus Saccharimonadales bacterium]